MFTRLANAWAKWKQRWADLRIDALRRNELAYEIACLEQAGELEGVLNNIGLGPGAVPYLLKRHPGAIRRHAALCKRLRIPGADARPSSSLGALRGAQLRCVLCPSARRCEQWLRATDKGVPPFCPSRAAFERRIDVTHRLDQVGARPL